MLNAKCCAAVLSLVLLPLGAIAEEQHAPAVISVDVAHPGAAISPQMYGVFFEDINFAADGGLYPELVKNRSFEFTDPLTAWHEIMVINAKGLDSSKGELDIRTDDPLNATNPHYLRLRVYEPGYGIYNTGFRGMGVESGAEYRFSAYVRSEGVKSLRAVIVDEKGKELATGKLEGVGGKWKHYETILRPTATTQHARLNLFVDEKGSARSRHGFAVSRSTRGTAAPTACAKISSNCSTICIPDSFAFPEAASSRAAR